ncbi:MAG TPA: type II secretion system protein [Candidatus Acidoferrum sp.]|nr:type II secretion system protein [Candidatus Acidoferrum sp.]
MPSKQRGFSLIELLIVVAVILVIAAIAVPNLLRSRMAANEASAVASLRSINTSQIVYQSTYGASFAAALADLSDGGAAANCAPPNSPTATSSCLIDAALASGSKSGYKFVYTPIPTGAIITSYSVTADPTTSGASGQRHFFTDETNVIRVNATAAAANTDPAI